MKTAATDCCVCACVCMFIKGETKFTCVYKGETSAVTESCVCIYKGGAKGGRGKEGGKTGLGFRV